MNLELIRMFSLGLALAAMVVSNGYSKPQSAAETEAVHKSGIKYITFDFNLLAREEAEEYLARLKEALGENPQGTGKMYGFGMCVPQLLTQSIGEMNELVNQGFDLAIKYDVPVFFHCDYMYDITDKNGGGAPNFYEDPMMCEWVGFPKEGEAHGRVPRLWFNWGSWQARGAMPCYESPKFKTFISKQFSEGIAAPIAARTEQLKALGAEYLFAGVSVGWETHIQELTPPIYNIDPENPPRFVDDPSIVMQDWEMSQTGYAALHWLGWNEKKLAEEQRIRGVTRKELMFGLLGQVTHDYMENIAKLASEAGIPKDKAFTHIVAIDTVENRNTPYIPPIWAGVNDYSVPGFTLSMGSGAVYDLDVLKKSIREVDPSQDSFACLEGYVNHLHGYDKFKGFIDELESNGATLINILGWTEPTGSPYCVEPAGEEIKAVRDWISTPIGSEIETKYRENG